jgi:predicted phosphate transport protein (TIGR00153 family)
MRFSIFPRNGRFYDLFAEVAAVLIRSSELLCDLLDHFEHIETKTRQIKDLEHEADNLTHDIYTLMNQTFVTPLDREDIAALAQRMDDVVDYIEATATSIQIYGITEPTPASRRLADLVRLQCVQLSQAIDVLRHRGKLKNILELAREINRLENEGDVLFLNAMAELFDGDKSITDIIKWREIYDQLESSLDSCENVAHILEAIVLKHG